jgi:hypothetical protein
MKAPALALLAAVLLGLALSAYAGGTYSTPTTISCTTTNQTCSATATSTCAGNIPDAGSATGITLANVQSYYVRVCPPVGQDLQGAGTAQDFHCSATTGRCAEVRSNRQSINAPATATEGATCWESSTFTIPYVDNTSDTMTWILSGVTVAPGDAGTATVSICPQQ